MELIMKEVSLRSAHTAETKDSTALVTVRVLTRVIIGSVAVVMAAPFVAFVLG
jgi:hypothetical protein